jgi:hypothetical protein
MEMLGEVEPGVQLEFAVIRFPLHVCDVAITSLAKPNGFAFIRISDPR